MARSEHLLWGGVRITPRVHTLGGATRLLSHGKVPLHSHSFGWHSQKSLPVHILLSADSQLLAGHSHFCSRLLTTFLGLASHGLPRKVVIVHTLALHVTSSWLQALLGSGVLIVCFKIVEISRFLSGQLPNWNYHFSKPSKNVGIEETGFKQPPYRPTNFILFLGTGANSSVETT